MKTKVLTLLCAFFLMAAGLQAQSINHNTDIYQSQIWSNDSIHRITANITLFAPATLTIQAGTEIRFENNVTFTIRGSVNASGFSNLITIKGYAGDIGLFKLVDAGSSSFSYVNFCYGVRLVIDTCQDVNVENCHFFGGYSQIPTSLIVQNHASPEIHNCQFYDNVGTGMYVNTYSNPTIFDCTFQGNGKALRVETYSSPVVMNCIFTGNNTGVLVGWADEPQFTNCTMNENNFDGVEIQGTSSNPLFTNCQFNQNNGNGIRVTNNAQATFTDCQAKLNGSHGLYANYSNTVTLNNFVANQNEGDGVYARTNLIATGLEVSQNKGFGLNFIGTDNEELGMANIVSHGNDTTAIRISPRLVPQLLGPNVELDFQNNHPDGIEVFNGELAGNNVWPEPPLNIDLYLNGLYIPKGASLEIIHPNKHTEFFCREESKIQVSGILKAENVSFKASRELPEGDKAFWYGIYFTSGDGSVLKNCYLNNAGYGTANQQYASIYISTTVPPQDSAVIIDDCNIEDGGGNGIYIYRSNPVIKNSLIAGCDSAGIYMDYYAKPYIDSCIIMQNGTYGIFCNHSNSGGKLSGGKITNNQGPPARLPTNMVGGINGMIIMDNQPNNRIEIAGGDLLEDATWSGDFEYYAYRQIRVDPGKLTIEPGAVLKFMPYMDMSIKTSLTAIGTSNQHIVFTSAQAVPAPKDWRGLRFWYATSPSHLSYCDIKYCGGYGDDANVYTEDSEVYLSHCDIFYGSGSGILNGSGPNGKYLYITDCNIHHNQKHGIGLEWFWYNYTHVSHTSIYDNGQYAIVAPADVLRFFTENINIHSNGHDAIKVIGGWEPGAFDGQIHQGTWRNHGVPYEISQHVALVDGDTLTIEKGNTFYMEDDVTFWVDGVLSALGDADSAITFTRMPDSESHWRHILFKDNEAMSKLEYCNFIHGGYDEESKSDTAAMISIINAGAGVKFQNCTIDSSASNGIYINHQASAEWVNSTIKDNADNGIYVGDIGDNNLVFGTSLAGWNDIYGNETNSISNNSTNTIDAGYIWWGTIGGDEIAAAILENTGTVNYTPWTNAEHTMLFPEGPPVHEINLPQGWSSLSSFMMPDSPILDEVFAPIADELIIAQTMTGVYYPAENTNTIGNWPQHATFIIKTGGPCTLPITGTIEGNRSVALATGWNLMPVVANSDIDVDDLFADFGSALIIVQEIAGCGVYWPAHEINTIETLQPGKAYLVKVSEDIVLEFPE